MNRLSAHLGGNVRSNALRRYLKSKRQVELEDCRSLEFFAYGPVYPRPSESDYSEMRGKVAAIEKQLWFEMKSAGYDMLNAQPQARAEAEPKMAHDIINLFLEELKS